MVSPAEISYLDKNINLSTNVFQHFQQTKDLVKHSINSLTQSAQQIGESWQQTATQATSQAVDTVTTNFGQAKASLEQTLESAQQVKSTTSAALQMALSSSVIDWFEQHPTLGRLVQIVSWAVNHPIISLVILLFALAIAWSLIKAIGRIIESASLSLLQVPLKLLQGFVKISVLLFTKVSNLAVKQLTDTKTSDHPTLVPVVSPEIHNDKQQRLVEISTRLENIQKEQNQLLQEAAAILASEKVDVEVPFNHYAELGINLNHT